MLKQTLALVGLSVVTLSANAALYDRGNGLIYDDTLDITWLQDANYAATQFSESGGLEGDADGTMGWGEANLWAEGLSYGGFDDWRLASANLMNGTNPCTAYDGSCDAGYNNTRGELGHMFYNNLGNLSRYDVNGVIQSGSGITNTSFIDGDSGDTVSFENLKNWGYWYLERSFLDSGGVHPWFFQNANGQMAMSNDWPKDSVYSWAVRAGDVSSVPVPAAAWLFGSALIGLVGIKRKK